jgi:hypothetical protein
VLLETKGFGFWKGFGEFVDTCLLKDGFISAADKHLYRVFHSAATALDHVELFYKNYHSMRYVKDKAVIRLKKQLAPRVVEKMAHQFESLAADSQFMLTRPLVEEENEPELNHLPRLVFKFDRQNFGGLRRLVDFINENS